jgi:hypothetical protein
MIVYAKLKAEPGFRILVLDKDDDGKPVETGGKDGQMQYRCRILPVASWALVALSEGGALGFFTTDMFKAVDESGAVQESGTILYPNETNEQGIARLEKVPLGTTGALMQKASR